MAVNSVLYFCSPFFSGLPLRSSRSSRSLWRYSVPANSSGLVQGNRRPVLKSLQQG